MMTLFIFRQTAAVKIEGKLSLKEELAILNKAENAIQPEDDE